VYYIPDPPYVLLVAGLLASIASGVAFEAVLKQSVQEWAKHRSTRSLAKMQGMELFLPFVGMALGVCLFLASGVEIFGFPTKLSYAIAVPLTVFISWLVWRQLGVILVQLERGGSRAIDLDALD
jgi:formate hydrogenlyase subunit 3/multisubunit Na+/H+ antiporter MnhD subunit